MVDCGPVQTQFQQALRVCETTSALVTRLHRLLGGLTSQPIDSPSLKIINGDFDCGRTIVKVQSVGVSLH